MATVLQDDIQIFVDSFTDGPNTGGLIEPGYYIPYDDPEESSINLPNMDYDWLLDDAKKTLKFGAAI